MNETAPTVIESRKTLLEATLELLKNRPKMLTYEVIAKETGVSVGWVRSLGAGATLNPGVNDVQTLYEYLAKKRLEV